MRVKVIIISIILFVNGALPLVAQDNATLKGKVHLMSEQNLDYYTVLLYPLADSTTVVWETFFTDEFEFVNLLPQQYRLKIQSIQIQPYETDINIKSGINIMSDSIQLKEVILNEIIIKGNRPALYQSNNALILDVQNTYLKDESKIDNIFNKTPGLILNNGSISMIGKQNLVFYINDKEVVSQEQIKSIQPSDIDKIEIIQTPGAEYSSSIDAIVKIKLRKKMGDNLNIVIGANADFSCKFSKGKNVSIYFNKNKVSQFLTYSDGDMRGKQYDDNDTYTYLDAYTSLNKRMVTMGNRFENNNIFYSLAYNINPEHTVGFQYSGIFSKWDCETQGRQIIMQNENVKETRNFDNEDIVRKYLHNFSINYNYQINQNNDLSIIADYVFSNIKNTNDINESVVSSSLKSYQYNTSSGDYDIFSINPEYKFSLKKLKYIIGSKYSMMKNISQIDYLSSNEQTKHDLKEAIGAVYISVSGKFDLFNFNLGLRGEYANSQINSDKSADKVDKDYWDLFPYITVSKEITDNINSSLYYRRFIRRPSFSALNPTFLYNDSLSYTTGNPYLRPMEADMFTFSLKISRLSFMLGYNIYQKYIFMEDVQDTNNPSIVISTYGNMKENNSLLYVNTNYSYDFGIFSGIASINMNKPFITLPFRDGMKKLNKPLWLFKLSTNAKLTDNTSLGYSFVYRTTGNSTNIHWKSYSNFSLDATQYLFNKKLMLAVSVSDLFDKNKTNRWTSYSNRIEYMMNSDPDSRYLSFTVRYNWGISNKQIQKKSSSTDSINRM